MWQDYLIAAVIVMFTLTTIPLIKNGVRLPLWTTVPMVAGSAILIITYVTLGLYLSVLIEGLALIGWTILLSRTFKRVRSEDSKAFG